MDIAMGSSICDMREMSKRMNERLNGRGGGSVQMAQGTFFAAREAIEMPGDQRMSFRWS